MILICVFLCRLTHLGVYNKERRVKILKNSKVDRFWMYVPESTTGKSYIFFLCLIVMSYVPKHDQLPTSLSIRFYGEDSGQTYESDLS